MNAQHSHSEPRPVSRGRRWPRPAPTPLAPLRVTIVLSLCMALQMTGYVMILPLFARRFTELGAGVEALGESAMAYALAGTLAAPFMGALADRFGRRRLVLASLAAFVAAFAGFLVASSALAIILLRGLAGILTAGLVPAVIGIVADVAPQKCRAQWIGIVNGGASVGWMAGPVLGGVLYDRWGYPAALTMATLTALAAFALAFAAVPETRRNVASVAGGVPHVARFDRRSVWRSFRVTLPSSLPAFAVLLWVCFAVMFAWAFIEPRFMFYAYDGLRWNASMLGLVMSTYGVAMTFGEFGLGRLSDRLGRKPMILLGLALFSAQFVGLAASSNYVLIAVTFAVAGLGNALFDPALSAALLDISPAAHRARLLGLKSMAASVGNILGPALVVLFSASLDARMIFWGATGAVLLTGLAALALPVPRIDSALGSVGPEATGSGDFT
jgi:MFS family permease